MKRLITGKPAVPNLHLPAPQPPWHVVRTHSRQEFRAEQNLQSGGIEVLLPRIRGPRSRRCRRDTDAAPLFPQYLFARFDALARLHDVSFTRGIQMVLRVGGNLAVVDDHVIAFLRSHMNPNGLIAVGQPLQPGKKVIIEDGPFSALVGVVERFLPDKERVIVLLAAVQGSFRVDVAAHSVRELSTPVVRVSGA